MTGQGARTTPTKGKSGGTRREVIEGNRCVEGTSTRERAQKNQWDGRETCGRGAIGQSGPAERRGAEIQAIVCYKFRGVGHKAYELSDNLHSTEESKPKHRHDKGDERSSSTSDSGGDD